MIRALNLTVQVNGASGSISVCFTVFMIGHFHCFVVNYIHVCIVLNDFLCTKLYSTLYGNVFAYKNHTDILPEIPLTCTVRMRALITGSPSLGAVIPGLMA